MSFHGNVESSYRNANSVSNHVRCRRGRLALALAAASALTSSGLALAGTITTSDTAPTGADISQPSNSNGNGNYNGNEDFSNNAGGVGEAFTPSSALSLSSVTIQGIDDAGSYGSPGLPGTWTLTIGEIPGYTAATAKTIPSGASVTTVYTDTFSGTPIATDVGNGEGANYDTFDLATAQSLTAGTVYFFNILSPGGSYYGLAKDATGTYANGIALNLATSGTTLADTQPTHDFVFFINGAAGGPPPNLNSQWNFNGSGNWQDASKWDDGAGNSGYPNTGTSTATFGAGTTNTVTTSPTVTLTGPVAVGTMNFSAPSGVPTGGYTVAGTSTLNLGGGGINVNSGTHTISTPLNMASGTNTFTVAAGAAITVDSVSGGGYGSFTDMGAGTLNIGGLQNVTPTINGTTNILDGTDAPNGGAWLYGINLNLGATLNLGANNIYNNNGIDGAGGTLNIGAGTTVTTVQYSSGSFAGSLSGPGALILGSAGGANSAGAPFTQEFAGASPNYSGPITAAYLSVLQVGAGATLGNASSTNTITLDSGELQAAGNATLAQNVVIEDTQGISPIPNTTTIDTQTNTLTLTGHISGGNSLLKIGTGTLILGASNSYGGGTTSVTGGTLVVGANGALPANSALSISGGSEAQLGTGTGGETLSALSIDSTSVLDITNNHLFIDYGGGSDPIATIASWIKDGAYGSGTTVTWSGTGITSSAAASNPNYGIGYADSADPGNPANLPVGTIEIKYTLLGDANLDSKVNGIDFNLLATNFNQAVTDGWDKGDFNYDGKVNGIDFNLLAGNFNQLASQSDSSAADLAALDAFAAANGISLTSVPEPASMGILVLAGVGVLRRRSRRQNW